jgi:hypothetical protein
MILYALKYIKTAKAKIPFAFFRTGLASSLSSWFPSASAEVSEVGADGAAVVVSQLAFVLQLVLREVPAFQL